MQMNRITEEQAMLAVQAGILAAGPAPEDLGAWPGWLGRVTTLARELAAVGSALREQLARVVKEMSITGVLDVPPRQNNPGRVNYTVDCGGRYPDTLWTDFFDDPAELAKERGRLEALKGQRVRLVKVTEVELKNGEPVIENGREATRSFAKGGRIELADAGSGDEVNLPLNQAKVRIYEAALERCGESSLAKQVAAREFAGIPVSAGRVRSEHLEMAIQRVRDALPVHERVA
jgi:hypothetical protein